MKQLNYTQARRCELAIGKVCKCRCNGILHGALRGNKEELESKEFYNELDELDPHHIDNKEQKKQKKEKWLSIIKDMLKYDTKIIQHQAFIYIKNLDSKKGIFQCRFCKGLFNLDFFDVVSISSYRNGWLHKCNQAKLITTEYNTYKSMISRCYNKDDLQYSKFGEKGIVVSSEWKECFENFLVDLELKANENVRLARVDRNRGYNKNNVYWYDETEKRKVDSITVMALHTLYKFNDEWFRFWLVEYDYGRPSKVIRTEDYQAPMTKLDGDLTFSRIVPCPDNLTEKWLDKFGAKFGYQNAKKIDNGKSQYIEQSLLPLEPASTNNQSTS